LDKNLDQLILPIDVKNGPKWQSYKSIKDTTVVINRTEVSIEILFHKE